MEPIYYVNLTGHIKAAKSKKITIVKIKEIVIKGNINHVINKKRFLREYFNTYKKVKDFDLNRLTIVNVEIIKSLGYGVKRE